MQISQEKANKIISETTEKILESNPDVPVKIRLLRDVCVEDHQDELRKLFRELEKHSLYKMLLKVEFLDDRIKTNLPKSLRFGIDDVFYIARNLGLSENHPLILEYVKKTIKLLKNLLAKKDWERKDLHGTEKFTKFYSNILGIPGSLAVFAPDNPLVIDFRDRAVKILEFLYLAKDFTIIKENEIWSEIYGDIISEKAFNVYMEMNFCVTEYPIIFNSNIFRLIGSGANVLSNDLSQKYCDLMLRRLEIIKGEKSTQDIIIQEPLKRKGVLARKEVFSREIARHLFFIHDLMLYPCWKELVKPFIQWLWQQCTDDGFWDFDSPHNGSGDADRLKLSENWRKFPRYQDWTTQILIILKKYYDDK